MKRSCSGESGQATIEHLGLVALVAVVLATAGGVAAAASPSIRDAVVSGFNHALCIVTGQGCDLLAREPCPTLRTVKTTSQGVAVAVVRLGHDRVLAIERRSDGTYVMSLLEGASGGAGLQHGVTRGAAALGAEASLMLGGRAGRTYAAATPEEARALVARLRRQPLPAAQSVIRGALDLAGLAGTDPSVTSYVLAGDGAVEALAKFGLGSIVEGGAGVNGDVQLGVRIAAHEEEITAYATVDARMGVFFDALNEITIPVGGRGSGSAVGGKGAGTGAGKIDVSKPGSRKQDTPATTSGPRDHLSIDNPLAVHFDGAAVAGGSLALRFGPGPRLIGIEIVGYAGTGSRQKELRARLDPSDPAVRAAVEAWRRSPGNPKALAALGRAAAGRAALDVRSFDTTASDHLHGAQGAVGGLALGGVFGSETAVSALTEQHSRLPGGEWEARTDCVVDAA